MSSLLALLLANLRYWTGVSSTVRDQIDRWRDTAMSAPEPGLRTAALTKLCDERFNVEVAATLATLAPRRRRLAVTTAIVALQIAYDYLDLLTESPSLRRDEAQQMLSRLLDVADLHDGIAPWSCLYLDLLLEAAASSLRCLPAARAVSPTATDALRRCVEGQTFGHGAVDHPGETTLSRWAQSHAQDSHLGWRELAAGASASVLCVHALIAAAASPSTTPNDACRLDSLYLSIGALTALDSLVDCREDSGAAQHSPLYRYEDAVTMADQLSAVAMDALGGLDLVHDGAHHAMTLCGVVAYYASSPAASKPPAREAFERLQRDLGWLLAAPLAVMRLWRRGKRLRGRMRSNTDRRPLTYLLDAHRGWTGSVRR